MALVHNDENQVVNDLQVDGAATFTGAIAAAGVVSGAGYRDITMFFNDGVIVDTDWTASTNGIYLIAHNKSAKCMYFPLSAMKEGDIIQKFRLLGGVEAIAGKEVTVDASLYSVTKAAAADCAATSLGAITQVAVSADTAIDSEKELTAVTVEDDLQYFVLIEATTANSDECATMVAGVEVDIHRLI